MGTSNGHALLRLKASLLLADALFIQFPISGWMNHRRIEWLESSCC